MMVLCEPKHVGAAFIILTVDVVSVMAAYAAVTLITSILVHWYQIRNFSKTLDVAP